MYGNPKLIFEVWFWFALLAMSAILFTSLYQVIIGFGHLEQNGIKVLSFSSLLLWSINLKVWLLEALKKVHLSPLLLKILMIITVLLSISVAILMSQLEGLGAFLPVIIWSFFAVLASFIKFHSEKDA